MGKIDTSGWNEFRVGDLFDIHPTKAYKCTNAELLDRGGTNVVVNSAYNNGIGGTSTFSPTENGNMITFSDTVDANTIFYQKSPFVGYPHVQGLYPVGKYQNAWTQGSLQYFVTVFRERALAVGFDYGNKFRRDIAANLFVKLPSTPDGAPDWAYMESYMAYIETKVAESLTLLQAAKDAEKKKVDTREWGEFHLYDIFSISMGNKFDRSKMCEVDEGINFVGRSALTNGVACTVTSVEDKKGNTVQPYPAGDITIALGGSIGAAFVQDREFYTSQNVCVLHTDDHSITERAKWFVSASITASCGNYEAFTDELNRHIRTDFIIRLPVDKTGQPDWAYMEEYMRKVEERVKKTINTFCVIRNIKFDC